MTTKQQLLIEYMISSPDIFALCKSITLPEYFDPEYRKVLRFIHEYYDKYSVTPSSEQIAAETNKDVNAREVTFDQVQYCCDEIESHCRQRAIYNAILASGELIDKEEYGKIEQMIQDAVTLSLDRDIGISYFDDPQTRLERLRLDPPKISTGWKFVDDAIGGGISPTEMILFSANSGGGKSVVLANLGLNFVNQGFDVVYISLELPENMVAQRYDMMISSIPTAPRVVWEQNVDHIGRSIINFRETPGENGVRKGSLVIKRLPAGTTSNQIRAYLKEYVLKHKKKPKLIIVDYLDIMNPNEKVSQEAIFTKDKLSAEQLRDIGFEYDAIIATASQQNRGSLDKDPSELNQGAIAGGISKVNTTDIYVSIVMTPQMKAEGKMKFLYQKTRSSEGVGSSTDLAYNRKTLVISTIEQDDTQELKLMIDKKQTNVNTRKERTKKSLADLMDTL